MGHPNHQDVGVPVVDKYEGFCTTATTKIEHVQRWKKHGIRRARNEW